MTLDDRKVERLSVTPEDSGDFLVKRSYADFEGPLSKLLMSFSFYFCFS